jgi:hypothetical protein
MRKLLLSILMIVSAIAASAQVPKASKPVCAYCGVDLTTGESHRSSCRYYKKEESSGESWAPNFNSIEYKYGNGVMCEQCGKTNGHVSDCLIGKTQGYARDYWAKSANSESAKFRIKTYEDNIRLFAKQGREARLRKQAAEQKKSTKLKDYTPMPERAPSSSSSSSSSFSSRPSSSTHYVMPSANIVKNYDKELSYGEGYARALGVTMPNGTERWLLANSKGEEVGQFSKVEFAEISGMEQYILVRDDNGQWGIYGRGGTQMCKLQYESIKLLSPIVGDNGYRGAYFDVTKRDERGVLRHGLVNPGDVRGKVIETIPCEYDYIEMIDYRRVPNLSDFGNYGPLAKVKKNGKLAIVAAETGELLIPAGYSYLNTYYTQNGNYFIVGDGTNFGAYANTYPIKMIIPVTNGITLDKVRNMIDKGNFDILVE